MRLLQVSLRSLLLYSLVLILVSIPVTFFAVRNIMSEQVDRSLILQSDQFIRHVKSFEYLGDLEMDIEVWDQLSYDISIEPANTTNQSRHFESISVYDSMDRDYHPYRILASPMMIRDNPYLLTIRMSLVDTDDLVMALVTVQVVLSLLLATGLLLLNRSLSRKLWAPFYRTLNQLKAYELDESEPIRPENTDIAEFNDLNKTVGHLTERSRKVFLQQKEFIENASHELQTPLAIFQSKLDMLMQNAGLNEHSAGIILELEDTAQRMSRLNKNLLLLSKIKNKQFTDKEDVDLRELIINLFDNVCPLAELNEIDVTTSLQPLHLQANKTLLEVLFINLCHNAIRHTQKGGKVRIQGNDDTITFSNTGQPLEGDPDKIFQRFYKKSDDPRSSGIGLAIVKEICDVCGYNLSYRYEDGKHAFSVRFRPAEVQGNRQSRT